MHQKLTGMHTPNDVHHFSLIRFNITHVANVISRFMQAPTDIHHSSSSYLKLFKESYVTKKRTQVEVSYILNKLPWMYKHIRMQIG